MCENNKDVVERFIGVSEDGKRIMGYGKAKDFRRPMIKILEDATNSNELFFNNLGIDYVGE